MAGAGVSGPGSLFKSVGGGRTSLAIWTDFQPDVGSRSVSASVKKGLAFYGLMAPANSLQVLPFEWFSLVRHRPTRIITYPDFVVKWIDVWLEIVFSWCFP